MEQFIDIIASNPLYLLLAMLIAVMVLWAILKRLIKAAVILFVLLVFYVGYLNYTGQPVPQNGHEMIEQGSEHIGKARDLGYDLIKDLVIQSITRKAEGEENLKAPAIRDEDEKVSQPVTDPQSKQ